MTEEETEIVLRDLRNGAMQAVARTWEDTASLMAMATGDDSAIAFVRQLGRLGTFIVHNLDRRILGLIIETAGHEHAEAMREAMIAQLRAMDLDEIAAEVAEFRAKVEAALAAKAAAGQPDTKAAP